MDNYHEKFAALRSEKHFTQMQIAKLINVPLATYALYELGRKEMRVDHFYTLCKFYKVSADSMLGLGAPISNAPDVDKTKEREKAPTAPYKKSKSAFADAVSSGFKAAFEKEEDRKQERNEILEKAKNNLK